MEMMVTKPRPNHAASASGRYGSDDARWNALLRRDREADGKFYYAVKTTGVYCRPSCAARRPRRENVSFHTSCETAEQQGFRPCRRCQPRRPALHEQYAAMIAVACRTIDASDDSPSLEALAHAAGISRFHFHRVFKRFTGMTPKTYAVARRAERLRRTLRKRSTITEAIYEAGYNSNSRFYEDSSKMLGMRASAFRNGGTGTTIRFAVEKCSLGLVLVAASPVGLCAIHLGDEAHALIKDLERQFPKAELVRGDRAFRSVVARVVGFVEQPHASFGLPLDVRGTAFQQRVWRALRAVPPGRTVTYSEIAARIGKPGASRAVGAACGANVLAVAIPCHRVQRNDGDLAGYRWGVKRKRALLKKEKTATPQPGNGSHTPHGVDRPRSRRPIQEEKRRKR